MYTLEEKDKKKKRKRNKKKTLKNYDLFLTKQQPSRIIKVSKTRKGFEI